MTHNEATSEVLNRAAHLIEQRGWQAGGTGWPSPERPSGQLCLEGGIMAALGFEFRDVDEDFWFCPAYAAVAGYLGLDQTPQQDGTLPEEPLYRWNDHEHRTADEVTSTLRAVALIEAAKEQAEVSA